MENIEYDWEERNTGNSSNLPLKMWFIVHMTATKLLSNILDNYLGT